jgi:uncharacterized protein
MRQIIFILVFLCLHWYAFQAIRTLTKQNWVAILYWSVGILIIANTLYQFSVGEKSGNLNPVRNYAIGFMFTMMAFNLTLIVFLFGEDIIRLLVGTGRKLAGNQDYDSFLPSRRKIVSQIALGFAALPFSALIYGMVKGKYDYRIINYTLSFPDLPDAFDGYQITQISDIHSGSFDNEEKLVYAVDLINQQKSDVILFTGDLVNNKAEEMLPWMHVFSELSADDGVFSILGNHDYGDYVQWNSQAEKDQNLEDLKQIQKEMGFQLLLNEHRFLEKNGERIALVGIENWGAGGFKKAGDLKGATENLRNEEFKILLSHDPSHWDKQVIDDELHYHLTLSGHTHGMQFGIEIPGWIKWSPVSLRYPRWAGLYQVRGQILNVNRGFGFLAYPGRVGIAPEITVIQLKKGNLTAIT